MRIEKTFENLALVAYLFEAAHDRSLASGKIIFFFIIYNPLGCFNGSKMVAIDLILTSV